METTDDGLLDNRIRILQPKSGYRVAIDTIFLAAAIPVHSGEHVIDIGCGVGAAALCLASRCPEIHVTGLEPQAKLADLARRNVDRNGLRDRVEIIRGSTADIASGPLAGQFDHAMANPPYYRETEGTPSPDPAKEAAQRRQGLAIADWVLAAIVAIKPGGTVTFIYPADRAAEIVERLEEGSGAICILPLLPKKGRPAKRVIVQFRRGGEPSVEWLEGLVLHQADGRFTDVAEAVLRGAAPLLPLGA